MYTGIGEEIDLDEEDARMNHQHHVYDKDGDEYWDGILAYLHMGQLPSSKTEVERIQRHSKKFFVLNGCHKPRRMCDMSHMSHFCDRF